MFGPVAILGDAEPGKTLIARTGGVVHSQDLVQGSEGFQWLRDGQPMEGETLRTYTVKAADIGAALSVAYSFRTDEGDQQVISKPELVDLGYWRNLYWKELGREPDAAGLAWWQDRVAQLFRDSIG
jgi:hypothetical protein